MLLRQQIIDWDSYYPIYLSRKYQQYEFHTKEYLTNKILDVVH